MFSIFLFQVAFVFALDLESHRTMSGGGLTVLCDSRNLSVSALRHTPRRLSPQIFVPGHGVLGQHDHRDHADDATGWALERPVNPKAWTCSSLKQLQGTLEVRYAGLTA